MSSSTSWSVPVTRIKIVSSSFYRLSVILSALRCILIEHLRDSLFSYIIYIISVLIVRLMVSITLLIAVVLNDLTSSLCYKIRFSVHCGPPRKRISTVSFLLIRFFINVQHIQAIDFSKLCFWHYHNNVYLAVLQIYWNLFSFILTSLSFITYTAAKIIDIPHLFKYCIIWNTCFICRIVSSNCSYLYFYWIFCTINLFITYNVQFTNGCLEDIFGIG
jgi:hypothetical protein